VSLGGMLKVFVVAVVNTVGIVDTWGKKKASLRVSISDRFVWWVRLATRDSVETKI